MLTQSQRMAQDLCHDLQRRAWDEAQKGSGTPALVAGLVAEVTRIRSADCEICVHCVFNRDCERMCRRGTEVARSRRTGAAA